MTRGGFSKRVFAAIHCASVMLVAAPTRAADGLDVTWSAPASCPPADAVRAKIVSLVSTGAAVSATAEVREAGDGFDVVLHVTSDRTSGERRLHESTCEALADSVAVIVAMSATRSPQPIASLAAPPSPPPIEIPQPVASVRRVFGWEIAAHGAIDVGTLPSPAVGVGIRAGRTFGKLSGALTGRIWGIQETALANGAPGGGRFQLVTVDASLAYEAVGLRQFTLAPYVVVDANHVNASAFGTLDNGNASALWIAVGAGLRARWAFTDALALGVDGEALASTTKEHFHIQDAGDVFATPTMAVRASFGPEVHF